MIENSNIQPSDPSTHSTIINDTSSFSSNHLDKNIHSNNHSFDTHHHKLNTNNNLKKLNSDAHPVPSEDHLNTKFTSISFTPSHNHTPLASSPTSSASSNLIIENPVTNLSTHSTANTISRNLSSSDDETTNRDTNPSLHSMSSVATSFESMPDSLAEVGPSSVKSHNNANNDNFNTASSTISPANEDLIPEVSTITSSTARYITTTDKTVTSSTNIPLIQTELDHSTDTFEVCEPNTCATNKDLHIPDNTASKQQQQNNPPKTPQQQNATSVSPGNSNSTSTTRSFNNDSISGPNSSTESPVSSAIHEDNLLNSDNFPLPTVPGQEHDVLRHRKSTTSLCSISSHSLPLNHKASSPSFSKSFSRPRSIYSKPSSIHSTQNDEIPSSAQLGIAIDSPPNGSDQQRTITTNPNVNGNRNENQNVQLQLDNNSIAKNDTNNIVQKASRINIPNSNLNTQVNHVSNIDPSESMQQSKQQQQQKQQPQRPTGLRTSFSFRSSDSNASESSNLNPKAKAPNHLPKHLLINTSDPNYDIHPTVVTPGSDIQNDARTTGAIKHNTFTVTRRRSLPPSSLGSATVDPDFYKEQVKAKREMKRKKQEDEEDDRVLVGKKVSEGHENYTTAYYMLTGIRVSVSRCNAKVDRELTDEDFKARQKLAFDISGNELIPSSKYDFKFKDYSPWVFRHLRALFKLDPADYLMSLTSKYILSELSSPGKSGSFFYFSRDFRFIIKTIHHSEHKMLRKILKDYYNHVKENPNTLISQFYGLHRIKLPWGKKVHFIVMNNLFPPYYDMKRTYDLKGSTLGREYVVHPGEEPKPTAVLKDLNWTRKKEHLILGPKKAKLFLDQLERDVALLKRLNIMDYSLLVGIHDISQPKPPRENVYVVEPVHGERLKGKELRKAVSTASPTAMSTLDLETIQYSKKDQVFYLDLGGFQSTDENDVPRNEIYFIGVIDCLTPYTFFKRVETFWKGMSHPRATISAIPAVEYGDRFFKFMKSTIQFRKRSNEPPKSNALVIPIEEESNNKASGSGVMNTNEALVVKKNPIKTSPILEVTEPTIGTIDEEHGGDNATTHLSHLTEDASLRQQVGDLKSPITTENSSISNINSTSTINKADVSLQQLELPESEPLMTPQEMRMVPQVMT